MLQNWPIGVNKILFNDILKSILNPIHHDRIDQSHSNTITLKHLGCINSCDSLMDTDSHSPSDLQKILKLKNVAVVGMSNSEGKPANFVPKYLIEHGYNVIPVNPTTTEVLGRKS